MSEKRRMTRAGSRASASSRAPSPPILDLHNVISSKRPHPASPAPERGSREGSLLPAIAPQVSTAYGGAGITRPGSINPSGGAPLTATLEEMLDDEDDELTLKPTSGRRRSSRTPSQGPAKKSTRAPTPGRGATPGRRVNRLGDLAAIDEDVPADAQTRIEANRANGTPVISTPLALIGEGEIETPQFHAREAEAIRPHAESSGTTAGSPRPRDDVRRSPPRSPTRQSRPAPTSAFDKFWHGFVDSVIYPLKAFFRLLFSALFQFLKNHWNLALGVVGAALVCYWCSSCLSSGSYRWYGFGDIEHNIGQFIPSSVANPYLDPDGRETVKNLLDRMRTVEYDIAYLKRQESLDEKSITALQNALPDFIVAKKDKSGKLQIPEDFWTALKEKISDAPDFAKSISPGSGMDTYSSWQEWWEKNEAQIRSWRSEDFEQAYNKHIQASFRNNVLVSKADLVKMLDEKYKASSKDVLKEIKSLNIELEAEIQRVRMDAQNAALTKTDVEKLVEAYLRKSIPKRQLDALAQVNLNGNLKDSLLRVNHFSLKTGAIIMPHETAPTYDFAKGRGRAWYAQGILWAMGRGLPRANNAVDALTPWEEHGDCWCSAGPSTSPESPISPPQLAVMTGNNMHPDTIVIEHIPSTATLNPGSAPRNIELLAYIEDGYTRGPLMQQSVNLMPEQRYDDLTKEGWVRIAKFRYDRSGPSSQAFPTQVRLADFVGRQGPEFTDGEEPALLRPFSRKYIIRVLDNYGEDFSCLYRVRLHGEIATKEAIEGGGTGSSMENDEVL